MRISEEKEIAIIGAGLTGLVAAYELSKQGFSVKIFEKSSDIGGLAGGFTINEHPIEKAYHHIFKTDTDIIDLLEEIGLIDEMKWFDSKVGMVTLHNGKYEVLPFNGAVDLLKYKPLSIIGRLRAGIITFFLQKYKGWNKLVGIPALNWVKKWSGVEVVEKIWGPLIKGKFSVFAEKISMAWLWARIHVRANSRPSIFAKEQLGYPINGFQSIPERLVEKIEENLEKPKKEFLLLEQTIEKISLGKKKNIAITINSEDVEFDAVLGTIPTGAYSNLLPKGTIESKIDYIGAITMTFSSKQSLSEFYWHNIIDEKAPFLAFLQHTNLIPKDWYKDEHIYYIGAYIPHNHEYFSMSQKELEEKWFLYLRSIFPEFNRNEIRNKSVFKFFNAQHIVDINYEENIPPYKLDLKGSYLSNFSQIFPEDRGTNYAVKEGKKIAKLIKNDITN